MGKNTGISWCDHTFNHIRGCTKVSPACTNCYAMELVNRFGGDFLGKRVVASESYWREPVKWNSRAKYNGKVQRVFCASLADVFEDWCGVCEDSDGNSLRFNTNERSGFFSGGILRNDFPVTLDVVRSRLFKLIDATQNLDWLLLTKRPENIERMIPTNPSPIDQQIPWFRDNLWLGTTTENQWYADNRIPFLTGCRDMARFLFLSCEPLLGPIELSDEARSNIDWVIVGGESGRNFRPMETEWVQHLYDQCKESRIAFFCKQGAGPKSGQQYDLPDHLFEVKEFPCNGVF